GQAKETDLPLLLEAVHFADCVLDRHVGIDAVLVIKVDDLDAEALQARLARRADIFRVAPDAEELAVRPAYVAELGGEEDFVAPVPDGLADQLLVLERSVHVGG